MQRGLALGGSARSSGGRDGGFRGSRLQPRVKPAGVDPSAKGFLGLGIDVSLPDEAPERSLDMGTRAAEPVIKIQVTEGRIEIVAPKQVNHTAAKPDAFGITGRTAQSPRCFRDLVDLFLGFLGCVGGRFLRLWRLAVTTALGHGGRNG